MNTWIHVQTYPLFAIISHQCCVNFTISIRRHTCDYLFRFVNTKITKLLLLGMVACGRVCVWVSVLCGWEKSYLESRQITRYYFWWDLHLHGFLLAILSRERTLRSWLYATRTQQTKRKSLAIIAMHNSQLLWDLANFIPFWMRADDTRKVQHMFCCAFVCN